MIGPRQGKLLQSVGFDPLKVRTTDGTATTATVPGCESMQRDRQMCEFVIHRSEFLFYIDGHLKLFVNLTTQTVTQTLTRFLLTPGKLPQARQHATRRPLSDQKFPSSTNDTRCHL